MAADELPLNSASEKSVRRRRKAQAFTRRSELDDVRNTLSTPHARRFLWRALAKCGVYTQTDIESTNRVLVNEGKRSIGLWLMTELEAAHPGAIELLRAEIHKDPTP